MQEEIEQIVENKFEEKKDSFASKPDLVDLRNEVQLSGKDMQTGFAELKSEIRAEFNKIVIWFVSTMFTIIVLLYTMIKLVG